MKFLCAVLRLPASAPSRAGLAGLLVVVLPPILWGPWLPLLDLVAFVGLDNYPPLQSSGPLHYAVVQFTYIVHYVLSRAMYALGLPVAAQVVILYLLQGVVFYVVIWRLLQRLVPEAWVCSVALAAGILAFWDGLFLWGGPLPFSLAATAFAGAAFFVIRETEDPERSNPLLPPLLLFLATMCHPFALLFAVVLAALRWIFVARRRAHSTALLAGLAVFGWIIMRDSPESGASAGLASLFTWPGAELPRRLVGLFVADISLTRQLFDFCPVGLQVYFVVLGGIHLLGLIAAPIVLVLARDARPLRLLAALNTVVALLYLCSRQNDAVIPGWPWRILTFHNPFTFLAGIACPLYLVRRWRPEWLGRVAAVPRAWWTAPIAVGAGVFLLQIPLFRLGEPIGRSLEKTRAAVLQSGIANAFVVVTNVDAIKPFYLRCVPFLLFSDPPLVARNLVFYTEWHLQNRHPTRLVEGWFDLGREAYQAVFSMAQAVVDVQLVRQPPRQVVLPVGNNQGERGGKPNLAVLQFLQANHLLQLGCVRDAILHYQAALRLAPEYADAHNNLGIAFYSSQQWPEAIAHFCAATRFQGGFVDAHANLGAALLQAGQAAEAREQFAIALRLNPQHARAREGLNQASGR